MIEAFLFDLDGTLLDSEILWVETIRLSLNRRGHPLSEEEALRLVYGRAWSEIREDIYRRYPDLDIDPYKLEKELEGIFKEIQGERDIRIPSSIELLVSLGKRFPVAIVSGSTRSTIAERIKLMKVEPYVRLFVGIEDYEEGKPDPSCFLLAAEKLGVEPRACLVFEDSEAGVRAAKAAGMTCVALRRPDRPPQNVDLADEVLSDLSEFRLEKYRPEGNENSTAR